MNFIESSLSPIVSKLSYTEALSVQKNLWDDSDVPFSGLESSIQGIPFQFLVFESTPVWTLGRQCQFGNDPEGIREIRHAGGHVIEVDRGGAATYHGPGQLVFFPIPVAGVNGRDRKELIRLGPKAWVSEMENLFIETSHDLGVSLQKISGFPGLYSESMEKVLSIGLRFTSRAILHGVALNWAPTSLEGFQRIDPCGLKGIRAQCLINLVPTKTSASVFLERMKRGPRSSQILSAASNCHH